MILSFVKDIIRNKSVKSIYVYFCIVRIAGALYNIVQDCDEVYNYWEPIHFLLYGYGKQPWEYSPQYGLRSYLFLHIYYVISYVPALIVGGHRKYIVFYTVKIAMVMTNAFCETYLHSALKTSHGEKVALYYVILSLISPGLFFASNTLVPSSFAMTTVTVAIADILLQKHQEVVVMGVLGVIIGWPVVAVAYLPLAITVLYKGSFAQSLLTAVTSSLIVLSLSLLFDSIYYGSWTVSQVNFLMYNVFGGGDSGLYGLEGPYFYIINGFLNFNFSLFMALLLPIVYLLGYLIAVPNLSSKLLQAYVPLFVWMLAITMLPHKEERFLYVVYPLIALNAAHTLVIFERLIQITLRSYKNLNIRVAKYTITFVLLTISLLSVMRIVAVCKGYSGIQKVFNDLQVYSRAHSLSPPTNIPNVDMGQGILTNMNVDVDVDAVVDGDGRQQRQLQEERLQGQRFVNVCIGSEWYRYPSSFFLPGPNFRLRFLNSGFKGLLPGDFIDINVPSTQKIGGNSMVLNPFSRQILEASRYQSPLYNDKNVQQPALFHNGSCDYYIAYVFKNLGDFDSSDLISDNYQILSYSKQIEAMHSPQLFRAFYIPILYEKKNKFGKIVLYQNKSIS